LWLQNIDFKDFACKFFEMKILRGIDRYSVRAASLSCQLRAFSSKAEGCARAQPFLISELSVAN